jgi:L-seryl-tRNA(Ser) seleniumtransferase
VRAEAKEDIAFVGGGSLPDQSMPTWVVEVQADAVGDAELARRLRTGEPAVLARVRDSKLVLDVRTLFESQEGELVGAVGRVAAGPAPA